MHPVQARDLRSLPSTPRRLLNRGRVVLDELARAAAERAATAEAPGAPPLWRPFPSRLRARSARRSAPESTG
jgi:hypothetical protein